MWGSDLEKIGNTEDSLCARPINKLKTDDGPYFASIIIVTFNHSKYLKSCIQSLEAQNFPHEIIVVDNGSTDGTIEIIQRQFSNIKLILSGKNVGYGTANNIGTDHAKGNIIVFLNPDTYVQKGWLRNLVNPILQENHIITTPKILTYNGKIINTCGNINHFSGLTFTRGLGKSPNEYTKREEVSGISGACFALKKADFLLLERFDESFFLYNEDSDFSWRAQLYGYKILFIPHSVVYHDYFLKMSPEKLYHLEKGRYQILRKYLRSKDIILFFPSLALTEIMVFFYSIKFGLSGLKFKFKSIKNGLRSPINETRGDYRSLFFHLSVTIPDDQLTMNKSENIGKKICNSIFRINYRMIQ
jgi:GT2 family glycosyltransferase